MENKKKKLFVLLIIISVVSISSGCLGNPKPYADIEYRISIWANDSATLYLPLPLDLPDYTVSDMVSSIKVSQKSVYTQVSYDVIYTNYGKALRINTTGNVVLQAKAGYEYLQTHPDVPVHPFIPGQNEPMFFDLSLHVNQTDKLNFERWAYLEKSNYSDGNIEIFEYLDVTTDPGTENWKTLGDDLLYYGNFTLKPGWQMIKFRHTIGYH